MDRIDDSPIGRQLGLVKDILDNVPAAEQRAIWTHYRKGQEIDKKPTREYLAALRAAVAAVAAAERGAQGSLF